MSTERVLFVVYDFPPEGARSTKRSLKFIRYLPEKCWSPAVLTVKNSPNRSFHDGSLLGELSPGVPVFRARTLENLFHGKACPHAVHEPAGGTKKAQSFGAARRAVVRLYHGFGKL